MIRSLTVENHIGEQLEIDLFNPYISGMAIRRIDGLGPPKALINAVSKMTGDGSEFVSARADYRPITLDITYIPCPDIEDSRLKTYQFFPIKKRIKLTIKTDKRTAYTYGYVESNEPNIFDRMSGCTISIVCPDSYLYDEDMFNLKLETSNVTPAFEFPVSNESINTKLIRFGEMSNKPIAAFDYAGDSDVGCVIKVRCDNGGLKKFVLTDNVSGDTFTINAPSKQVQLTPYPLGGWDPVTFNPPMAASSEILIDTRHGNKRVLLSDRAGVVPEGEYANILNWVDLFSSKWIQIHDGLNVWSYSYESDTDDPGISVSVEAPISYQGV